MLNIILQSRPFVKPIKTHRDLLETQIDRNTTQNLWADFKPLKELVQIFEFEFKL